MSKINIAFFETKKWEEKYLRKKLQKINANLLFCPEMLDKKTIKKYKNIDIASVFIYSKINKDIISQLPKLKYIATMSTGFDHIDLKACQKRNIKVSNVPYYGENTVAEHTFALILSISRKIPQSINVVRSGGFSPKGLMGFDLKNKTIGIIGTGHIGEHVARIAQGFEMKILAYDIKKNVDLIKQYNVKYVSLNKLLKSSDIISLHVPYNKHTHHLINKNNIKLFKKTAYIINTSRGALIDTKALLRALSNNKLAGAGLDVLEEEGFIKEEKELLSSNNIINSNLKTALRNHVLIEDKRIIITPHNAFNSQEALERILGTTADNIKAFMRKRIINKIAIK